MTDRLYVTGTLATCGGEPDGMECVVWPTHLATPHTSYHPEGDEKSLQIQVVNPFTVLTTCI